MSVYGLLRYWILKEHRRIKASYDQETIDSTIINYSLYCQLAVSTLLFIPQLV